MHKIGVIGDRESVLCFKALGLDVFPVLETDHEENRKIVDMLARDGYGVIFITEHVAMHLNETIARYSRSVTPAIILIPGSKGSMSIGLNKIRENVFKAVGINILD